MKPLVVVVVSGWWSPPPPLPLRDAEVDDKATRTTTPSVYNTSSTITVHYHLVGDTNAASYTVHKHTYKHTQSF